MVVPASREIYRSIFSCAESMLALVTLAVSDGSSMVVLGPPGGVLPFLAIVPWR